MSPDPSTTSGNTERIFGTPRGTPRPSMIVIEQEMCDTLVRGARTVAAISGQEQKAQHAVLVLDQVAQRLEPQVPPAAFARMWGKWSVEGDVTDAIGTLRSTFSLDQAVLNGFRESDPVFCFRYVLYRGLFDGRLPVLTTDLKDTLAVFVNGGGFSKLHPKHQSAASGFKGVRTALDQLLTIGAAYLVTGDTHDTVVEQFVVPNGWVKDTEGTLRPTSPRARNLVWAPRTGMEIVRYSHGDSCFVRSQLVQGMSENQVTFVQKLLSRVYTELSGPEKFGGPIPRFAHISEFGPGTMEVRRGEGDNNNSVAFFPAGILLQPARAVFKADPTNALFLENFVKQINTELATLNLSHIRAKRGGLSTVDLVTADKGVALSRIKAGFLSSNDLTVFLGDRIALNGNDVEAIREADVSVQVGNEWDPTLFPAGDRTLIRSRTQAAEGGSAQFIGELVKIRRLGLTQLLTKYNGGPLAALTLPSREDYLSNKR